MAYNYSFKNVAGKTIPVFDAHSRLEISKGNEQVNSINLETGIYWNAEYGVSWEQLVKETAVNKMLKTIMKRVRLNDWKNVSPAELAYKKNQNGFCVENSVLVLGTRPAISLLLRK